MPALKNPMATERSRAGNHSLTAFTPAGIAADSLNPRSPRKKARDSQPPAKPWAMLASDQATAKSAKASFRPRESMIAPQIGCMAV